MNHKNFIAAADVSELEQDKTAPQFKRKLSSVTANEGEDAILECTVGGYPQPNATWYKDGSELPSVSHTEQVHLDGGVEKLIVHNSGLKYWKYLSS